MELSILRPLGQKLREFSRESKTGDKKIFIKSEQLETINGCCEDLYMTKIEGGVIAHYGTDGDWTKALLVTEENLATEEEKGVNKISG